MVIVRWTEKRQVKGEVTAYRFLVSCGGLFYRISGRIPCSQVGPSLCDMVITETTADCHLRGHDRMDLSQPQTLTTENNRDRAIWTNYLQSRLETAAPAEDVLERSFDDKRRAFFDSPYCKINSLTEEDEHALSLPDTDSNINLSLCSDECDVIESIRDGLRTMLVNLKPIDHSDDPASHGSDEQLYYDEVSYRKAKTLNVMYGTQEKVLVDILPYYIHVHVPEIMDHLRFVHCDPVCLKNVTSCG